MAEAALSDTNAPQRALHPAARTATGRGRGALVLRLACLLLALSGWWLSRELFVISGGGSAAIDWLNQTCQAEAGTNSCVNVLRSGPGRLKLGQAPGAPAIPVATLGMAYFAALALWFLFIGPASARGWAWHLLLLVGVLVGVAVSVLYLITMGYVLGEWCALCVAVHVINFAIAALTIVAFPWRRKGRIGPEATRHPRWSLVAATLTAGLSVAVLHLVVTVLFVVDAQRDRVAAQLRPIVTDPAFVQWHHGQREQHTIPVEPQRPLIGNIDAAHTAVLFVDYRCAACRGASALLGDLAMAHPDRLRVAYRHFPQNAACNPAYEQNFHPGSCAAAIASEAAWEAGGADAFRAMSELLYDRQARIRPETPFEYWAAELDLDTGAFQQAATNPELAARVAADAALGDKLGVAHRGPPGIFLDGQLVVYWNNEAAWRTLLGLPAVAETDEAADPAADE